jgi:hypothetical protein
MTASRSGARLRAIGSAAFLLLTGAAIGITVDRTLIAGPADQVAPLTAESMVARLGLSADEARKLNLLLDSLHAELSAAMVRGPEALREATSAAHRQIDASLPPEARADFHVWMQEHHDLMMAEIARGPLTSGTMHHVGGMDGTATERSQDTPLEEP